MTLAASVHVCSALYSFGLMAYDEPPKRPAADGGYTGVPASKRPRVNDDYEEDEVIPAPFVFISGAHSFQAQGIVSGKKCSLWGGGGGDAKKKFVWLKSVSNFGLSSKLPFPCSIVAGVGELAVAGQAPNDPPPLLCGPDAVKQGQSGGSVGTTDRGKGRVCAGVRIGQTGTPRALGGWVGGGWVGRLPRPPYDPPGGGA